MKPVLILCLAVLCLSVVLSAPAPSGLTFAATGVTLGALGVSDIAALAGAGLLKTAVVLALTAPQQWLEKKRMVSIVLLVFW